MIDHVGALQIAHYYSLVVKKGEKFNKREAVKMLAAFRLFTQSDVAKILMMTPQAVAKAWPGKPTNEGATRVWFPHAALDSMLLIASEYKLCGTVNKSLINLVHREAGLRTISELTGVPLDDVRRAVHDPDLLDILRAGAKPSGG